MFKHFFKKLNEDRLPPPEIIKKKKLRKDEPQPELRSLQHAWDSLNATQFVRKAPQAVYPTGAAMDAKTVAMDASPLIKSQFNVGQPNAPIAVLDWYSSQGFLGFQILAILSQHWLVDKACTMPAKDALRKGFEITVNDGTEIAPDVRTKITELNKAYRLNQNLVEFVRKGRIFGIRVAMFKIVDPETRAPMEEIDPDFYFKPFNIDGILPGSYEGISQIDPYWLAPELDNAAAGDPSSIYFYEPTWWLINGKRVHRTHLIIMRTNDVPDVLKPTYFYAGVSVPQKIFERVYAAERTANEAPLIALTKRTFVMKTDISKAIAKQMQFQKKLEFLSAVHTNTGTRVIDLDDDFTQLDTGLADLDAVIMTQYQIVAAAAEVPATKLLGTTPKGFNATGEYEEASYHELLESIQSDDYTPMIERHLLLLIKSEIAPLFGIQPFEVTPTWLPLDTMTAKEKAETNRLKAETDKVLAEIGAINGQDSRDRVITDADSGYNGLSREASDAPEDEELQNEVNQLIEKDDLQNGETTEED